MNGFFIIITIIAVVYFCSPHKKESQKLPYTSLCILLLFCSCFRSIHVGIDTPSYVEHFQIFRNLSWSEALGWYFEPGYIALNKLIGYFTGNSQVFIAVLSLIILLPILWITWKKSANPVLSLFVFVIVQNWYSSFAALRQWCAVAVLVSGFDYIIKRKPVKFAIVVVIASMFHKPALVFLPLYFFYTIRITRIRILFCLIASVGILILADEIMGILNRFARIAYPTKVGGGVTLYVVLWIVALMIDIFASPIENEAETKLVYLILLYSATLQALCMQYGEFARIHLYFWYGLELGIPGLEQFISRNYDARNLHFMKILIIAVLVLWYAITFNGRVFSFFW